GGQDALGKLIVRQVLLQARSYPRLKPRRIGFECDAVGVDAKVAGLEQVAKLQGPQRRVARPFKDFLDLLCPFLRGFVGEEATDFLRCRQLARNVERYTPQERAVVGEGRGRKIQPAQLGEDLLVDEVVARDVGKGFLRGPRHDDKSDGGLG